MAKLRITYNAPVILTFTIAAVGAFLLNSAFESSRAWFMAYPTFDVGAKAYVGLFSHILGHANWQHLMGNFMLILLIGPILEERHGSLSLLIMIAITALVTGLATALFSHNALLGASGEVFMMILLASTANIRAGEIPLTFIAIAIVYLGGEVVGEVKGNDNVSHFGHLVGGAVGAAFGFIGARTRTPKPAAKPALSLGLDDKPLAVKPAAKPAAKK